MSLINKTAFLIKHFEGLRLDAYHDNKGHLTIGYGSLIRNLPQPYKSLRFGQRITLDEANILLQNHLENSGINYYLKSLPHNDNQKAAMASFFYHHGLSLPTTKKVFEDNDLAYWSMQKWFFDNWDNNNPVLKERNFNTINYYFTGALLPQSNWMNRKKQIDANLTNDEIVLISKKKNKFLTYLKKYWYLILPFGLVIFTLITAYKKWKR